MSVLDFSKNRGKLFVMFKRMVEKHERGYTHVIKLGIGPKRVVYCLRPKDVMELRDRILEEYPLDLYPKGSTNE